MIGRDILKRIVKRLPIVVSAAMVVAHYDDEVLAAGGSLGMFRDVTIIHVTDSGHQDPTAWHKAGVVSREAYAAMRRAECVAALEGLDWTIRTRRGYEVPDQRAVLAIPAIVDRLIDDLADVDVVITHAYEGGHPDHDATACAVQLACVALQTSRGSSPVRLECTGYHLANGARRVGEFCPDAARPAVSVTLPAEALVMKRRALAHFTSQASVIRWFRHDVESFRVAPDYDFSQPPPTGACLFDRFGWALTGETWRGHARAALAEVAL
jgi:LmbE family N-acetylglucosaminyl deacetylase